MTFNTIAVLVVLFGFMWLHQISRFPTLDLDDMSAIQFLRMISKSFVTTFYKFIPIALLILDMISKASQK